MSRIEITNIRKTFPDGTVAVDGVSFTVEPGEVVSLLGPSGCGKTTTLRCIAGLETPDAGSIVVGGKTLFDAPDASKRVVLPPEERGISMVFQQYALWPHMTVGDNVAFGLSVRGHPKSEVEAATDRALQKVQLLHLKRRNISQLSGGQQQRVALARAIAFDPAVILFDEPLSNLDAKLREEMRLVLLELQRDLGFTALYVTHDQLEAISLSSRVAIMHDGRIEQIDTPQDVWNYPNTTFVADFLGESDVFDGVIERRDDGFKVLRTDEGLEMVLGENTLMPGARAKAYVGIGNVELLLDPSAKSYDTNVWKGQVTLVSFQGASTLAKVAVGDARLIARIGPNVTVEEGQLVGVHVDPGAIRCYEVTAPAERQPTEVG